jgi:hypothetical protein
MTVDSALRLSNGLSRLDRQMSNRAGYWRRNTARPAGSRTPLRQPDWKKST